MNKSSLKKNFSLPIIDLSKEFFNIYNLQNSQNNIEFYTIIKNDSKRKTINSNTPSSRLKKIKPKVNYNPPSLLCKQNIKNSLINYEKSAKKVRLLKEIFSNNLFPKRLSPIKQKKSYIPIQLRNEYVKTIKRKKSLRFDVRHNSRFVRDITTNFMINNYSIKKNNNENYPNFHLDEKFETSDKFYDINFDDFIYLEKIKKIILSFNSHYQKISKKTEKIFKGKENYINFIEDCYKIPYLKNKLQKLKSNKQYFKTIPINYIKPDIIIYLNKLRINNQINNEEEALKEHEEIKQKNDDEEIYESEIDKLIKDNTHLLQYKEEERIKNNFIKTYENRVKTFIHFKFNKFQKIQISNEKDRNAIFSIFE